MFTRGGWDQVPTVCPVPPQQERLGSGTSNLLGLKVKTVSGNKETPNPVLVSSWKGDGRGPPSLCEA